MRYKKTPESHYAPRLLVEKAGAYLENVVGFLYVNDSVKKIEIGAIEGREFRLVQCLFSPQNALSAKYNPVTQTHERVFGAIGMSQDLLNKRLSNPQSIEKEMISIVETSLRNLRKREVGKYLTFLSEGGRVRMELAS